VPEYIWRGGFAARTSRLLKESGAWKHLGRPGKLVIARCSNRQKKAQPPYGCSGLCRVRTGSPRGQPWLRPSPPVQFLHNCRRGVYLLSRSCTLIYSNALPLKQVKKRNTAHQLKRVGRNQPRPGQKEGLELLTS
jgi:hypothetical protein